MLAGAPCCTCALSGEPSVVHLCWSPSTNQTSVHSKVHRNNTRSPWLFFSKAWVSHQMQMSRYLDVVLCVQGESVVHPLWQNDHDPLCAFNPDPFVFQIAHIEVSCKEQRCEDVFFRKAALCVQVLRLYLSMLTDRANQALANNSFADTVGISVACFWAWGTTTVKENAVSLTRLSKARLQHWMDAKRPGPLQQDEW